MTYAPDATTEYIIIIIIIFKHYSDANKYREHFKNHGIYITSA
jgi:hypothetical protein